MGSPGAPSSPFALHRRIAELDRQKEELKLEVSRRGIEWNENKLGGHGGALSDFFWIDRHKRGPPSTMDAERWSDVTFFGCSQLQLEIALLQGELRTERTRLLRHTCRLRELREAARTGPAQSRHKVRRRPYL